MKIHNGPYGGGNQFGISLFRYLTKNGWNVVFDLNDKDIDLILITDPRQNSESKTFDAIDVLRYINKKKL